MMEPYTVLVVDDVKTNLMIMGQSLKGLYQILEASSGAQCLKLARSEPQPDLILLDVVMPDLDGYEVCRALKSDPATAEIPIIFVTGKDSDEDEQYGLELGAVDYITKPIRPAIVRARVCAHIQLKQQRDRLQSMAMHDQLTGLYNRHFLIECASQRLARVARHRNPMTLVLMDVDHFKRVNDNYGHHVGDKVLIEVARLLSTNMRREDVVARLGGEEFVMLMDCSLDNAAAKVEHLRHLLEALEPDGIKVTGSFGLVEASPYNADFSHLLVLADDGVYRAKTQGRNCVVCHRAEAPALRGKVSTD
ncbi:diguanylate cyclase [Shewanella amazonensis]|uniref:diguanylate cyclase n=1 Tax=Shewanella amazonensis (strain ATCC BAA-1098 / SB2B) TaxID=326297 RepID=A1S1M1_SHEAM|nr:diguanylate cyclase [Shewanella amazonensis]ABL98277.1 response regulator receiver modulated diguanylate cyclase [Shewanella amazonensis SB2B]